MGSMMKGIDKTGVIYYDTKQNHEKTLNGAMNMTNPQMVETQYSQAAFIWVTFQFEAFHAYKDAPKEVYFLREPHRHMFKVRVEVEVHHDDREIEFIMFKNMLEYYVANNDMNNMSCEMMCDKFFQAIVDKYKLLEPRELGTETRRILIEVSEDGENGACKVYHPSNAIKHTGDRWF